MVVAQLWKVFPGHYDQPRSSLSGHLVEMHGKWPIAGCYFALWFTHTPRGSHQQSQISALGLHNCYIHTVDCITQLAAQ